jgi:hypothetical protein
VPATESYRNAFDALCELASKEKWCWKISCTTCGHMYFRYGLREILLGRHPDSAEWVVTQTHPVLKRGGQPTELGKLPPRSGHWPIAEQELLLHVLAGANIGRIRSICTHPDWLGYLGLALLYSEEAEREARLITKAWVPQLIQDRPQACARELLESILASNEAILTWQNLEALE